MPDGTNHFVTPDQRYRYPVVCGLPVLIDFDRSVVSEESVIATAGQSLVQRAGHQGVSGLLKSLVSPTDPTAHENVRLFIDELKRASPEPTVLVIGGGTVGKAMQPLYDDPRIRVLAFDIYHSSNIQFLGDAHSIPLPDEAVDGVVAQAVLEHVLQPADVVSEISRVLRTSGLVYAETPFLQHVHEGPYDFTRYTDSGHRYLFRRFELIRSGVMGGTAAQLLWSLDHFARGLFRSVAAGKLVKLAFFWLRYLDRFIPTAYAIDAASGSFFLGRKSTAEIMPRDIVGYYQGAQRRR